jgi:hypothetical protein
MSTFAAEKLSKEELDMIRTANYWWWRKSGFKRS